MSILAAPRKKQRISVDPQNKNWKNDTGKFGHKLMEKMGWSEGKGLGAKMQGNADTIKLKANWDSKGLGCVNKPDATWMAHHDDFADLLAKMNEDKEKAEPTTAAKDKQKSGKDEADDDDDQQAEASGKSLEHKSKQSKARIHYHKFTRGKDLARYSSEDKSSVLGGKSQKRKAAESQLTPSFSETDTGDKIKSQVQTTVSSMSVGDYFAMKMKKLKKSSPTPAAVED